MYCFRFIFSVPDKTKPLYESIKGQPRPQNRPAYEVLPPAQNRPYMEDVQTKPLMVNEGSNVQNRPLMEEVQTRPAYEVLPAAQNRPLMEKVQTKPLSVYEGPAIQNKPLLVQNSKGGKNVTFGSYRDRMLR